MEALRMQMFVVSVMAAIVASQVRLQPCSILPSCLLFNRSAGLQGQPSMKPLNVQCGHMHAGRP
jgi:hypothetical protein